MHQFRKCGKRRQTSNCDMYAQCYSTLMACLASGDALSSGPYVWQYYALNMTIYVRVKTNLQFTI